MFMNVVLRKDSTTMLNMSSPHYNMGASKSTLVFLALLQKSSKRLWTSIPARTSDLLPIVMKLQLRNRTDTILIN